MQQKTLEKLGDITAYIRETGDCGQYELMDRFSAGKALVKKAKTIIITEYIEINGPQKQKDLMSMFRCGKALAKECMDAAGYSDISSRDWEQDSKLGVSAAYIEKLEDIAKRAKPGSDAWDISIREFGRRFKCGGDTYPRVKSMVFEGLTAEQAIEAHNTTSTKLREVYRESREDRKPTGKNLLHISWKASA